MVSPKSAQTRSTMPSSSEDCARRHRRRPRAEQPNVHRTASAPPPRGPNAERAASASYDDRYHEYNVHLQSNQPDPRVTVTDAAGHTDTWHTDSSGYTDVYFHALVDAAGEEITARVDARHAAGRCTPSRLNACQAEAGALAPRAASGHGGLLAAS
jgi:hypothetical protein